MTKKYSEITYSSIKEKFDLDSNKIDKSTLATFTHLLQKTNTFHSYPEVNDINDYLKKYYSSNVTLEDSSNQLQIIWDITFPPHENPEFTFIDLFAGIGGIRLAFQNLFGKCVFTSEWDTYSQMTYQANFGELPHGDITKISEIDIPDHDILLGGFPCQPFSLAGVSKKNSLGRAHGFLDETQGTLFFDLKRIIKAKRPKAFLLENVKNLVSHDKGKTFSIIKNTLNELDYEVFYQILDGKHFVPQHRERIIIVGFDKRRYQDEINFEFPLLGKTTSLTVKSILEKNPNPKYTLSDKLWKYLRDYAAKHKALGNGFGYGLVDLNGITRTLSARYHKDGSEILIPQEGKNPRRLTPHECAQLQGFPKNFVIPVSDTQAYRQFGNSVVVPLMQAVGKNIVNEIHRLDELNYTQGDISPKWMQRNLRERAFQK